MKVQSVISSVIALAIQKQTITTPSCKGRQNETYKKALGSLLTSAGKLLTVTGWQFTSVGKPLTPAGRPLTMVGSSLTAVGRPLTVVGRLLTAVGSPLTTVGRQLTAAGSSLTPVGRQLTTAGTPSTTVGKQTATKLWASPMPLNSAPSIEKPTTTGSQVFSLNSSFLLIKSYQS